MCWLASLWCRGFPHERRGISDVTATLKHWFHPTAITQLPKRMISADKMTLGAALLLRFTNFYIKLS